MATPRRELEAQPWAAALALAAAVDSPVWEVAGDRARVPGAGQEPVVREAAPARRAAAARAVRGECSPVGTRPVSSGSPIAIVGLSEGLSTPMPG
jgi:hypothetical protein